MEEGKGMMEDVRTTDIISFIPAFRKFIEIERKSGKKDKRY